MQNQINELRARIKMAHKEFDALSLENQRLGSLHSKAQIACDAASEAIGSAQDVFSRISMEQPGTPEGMAAYARLTSEREQGKASQEQLRMIEQALENLAFPIQEARIQAEISSCQNLMWGAIQDAELARLGPDARKIMVLAFAASRRFSGSTLGTLQAFIGHHFGGYHDPAMQPPNPFEIEKMQAELQAKYKV